MMSIDVNSTFYRNWVTRNSTVSSECMSAFQQTADCRRLYVKYDACVGDVANNNTVYFNFYEQLM